jgi:hypothetical protein
MTMDETIAIIDNLLKREKSSFALIGSIGRIVALSESGNNLPKTRFVALHSARTWRCVATNLSVVWNGV